MPSIPSGKDQAAYTKKKGTDKYGLALMMAPQYTKDNRIQPSMISR